MKKVLISIFVAHFILIITSVLDNIHVLPDGALPDLAKLYTVPFFEQNWSMFSNPPTNTRRVYFQYQIPHEVEDSVYTSNWYDVNSTMYNYNQSHLFSVAQRLIKYESGCLNNMFQRIEKCKDPTPDLCIEFSPGFIALRNYANIIYDNSSELQQVDEISFVIKVVEEHYPGYADRHLDYFDKENYEYAVHTTKAYALR